VSAFLAASLLWARFLIPTSGDPADDLGSGADPFIWFAWVSVSFLAFVVVQVCFGVAYPGMTRAGKARWIGGAVALWPIVFATLVISRVVIDGVVVAD
jgi:hypothetical protein